MKKIFATIIALAALSFVTVSCSARAGGSGGASLGGGSVSTGVSAGASLR